MTDNKDFTRFGPDIPQYKALKNGEFTSLNLTITDQNNNVITDGPQVTVVLHIHECKKMYITIDDVICEKTIDLSDPIQNFNSSKEVAVSKLFKKAD